MSEGGETSFEDLQKEAEHLAGHVRQNFLLLIGASGSMFLTLSVSNVRLILGNDEIVLPLIDVPATLSSLIVIGPVLILCLMIYMHLLLERLHELAKLGAHPPQIYFFTIRNKPSRIVAVACLYIAPPAIMWWYFFRTSFRPEAWLLLTLACLTLLGSSAALMHRSPPPKGSLRGLAATAFCGASALFVVMSAVGYASYGMAPFRSVTARITDFGLQGADLSKAAGDVTFIGFNFDGQCLSEANLSGLDFSGASFAGADLSGADLSGAILTGADLRGSDLTGANLMETRMDTASLAEALVMRARAERAVFDDADLSASRFDQSTLTNASLLRVNAPYVSFRQSTMNNARLSGATLTCGDFRETEATRALFQRLSAEAADFTSATLTRSNFVASLLDDADFSKALMTDVNVGGASLLRTDLSGALLGGANLDKARAGPSDPVEGARAERCTPIKPLAPQASPCARKRR